jgi:4a-hydroxytetrahydrobiopterin dehydratase
MARLSDEEISERLTGSGWRRDGDRIIRDFAFAGFAGAMAFVNRVADAAQAAGHHPDILIHGCTKVRLSVADHGQGDLTAGDFDLARTVDRLL